MWYYISPFGLIIIYLLVQAVIDRYTFDGDTTAWSHTAAALLLPSFFILGLLGIVVRVIIRKNALWIWVIELGIIMVLLLTFNIWINSY